MPEPRVVTRYRIETPHSLDHAAESLAGEQSSSTFVDIPAETEELRERHRGRVETVEKTGRVDEPSLPGAEPPSGSGYIQGEVSVSFPLLNLGTNLPTLLATIAGNLFELKELSGVKLVDVELPDEYVSAQPGPAFGVAGTRELAGVYDRPIIGTIIKPSVGLSPEQTADLVRDLGRVGIDFVKDDELMANPPHSPFDERVEAVMNAINDVADETGKKVMYAFNVSDTVDAMRRHHDNVLEAGGTCVMVSLNGVGPAGVRALRKHSELPIHGHRNGWGMLTRHPFLGMEFPAYQKIGRLVGIDHIHVNGLRNKFWEPDDSVIASIEACQESFAGQPHIMPVISSGQWGGQAPETYRRTGTTDLMYLAGGGIMGHPGGPEGGFNAIRQSWEAAVEGIDLEVYAETHEELRQAIDTFGDGQ